MIAQLRGNVARSAGSFIVLDVGGVGYKIFVPVTVLESLPEPGQPVTLHTHTLVREDDLSLYGFLAEIDLEAFELLLTVSGVGPKAALALLSAMTAEDLAQAIAADDVRTITRTPGIGPKTAQRMLLELRDKFARLGFARRVDRLAAGAQVKKKDEEESLADDVLSALTNLGYNKTEAQRAAAAALDEKLKSDPSPKFADVLRAALNRLTKA
ncbi:MAG TPA: Holliday junction branch migration protein RuvA [Armatimonadaceae bacterium]|nr:Holliday junction branch migration protein RuvA [Armatimonadaceae bacterium]